MLSITTDQYIIATNSSGPYISNTYNTRTDKVIGQLQYNTTANGLEVWDGYSFVPYRQHVSMGLSSDVAELLEWLKKFKEREESLTVENNPTLADLLRQRKDINDKIDMILLLQKAGD